MAPRRCSTGVQVGICVGWRRWVLFGLGAGARVRPGGAGGVWGGAAARSCMGAAGPWCSLPRWRRSPGWSQGVTGWDDADGLLGEAVAAWYLRWTVGPCAAWVGWRTAGTGAVDASRLGWVCLGTTWIRLRLIERCSAGPARWLEAQQRSGENTGDTDTHTIFVELKESAPANGGAVGRSLGPSER